MSRFQKPDLQRFKYPKDIDTELVPLLDTINSVPGLRTMFCCSGHGKEPFYMMIACCNKEIAKHVFDIFNLPYPKNGRFTPRPTRTLPKDGDILSRDNKFTAVLDDPVTNLHRGFCPQEKISISIYSSWLGCMKARERKKELAKLQKTFLGFVPRMHW